MISDFSADRFYGMPEAHETATLEEITSVATEFRDNIEFAWCKQTAYPQSQEVAGRFSAEGQCAVTMHLFLSELKARWPDLDAHIMLGSVVDKEGTPYTTNHAWTEVKISDHKTLVLDLTPDQTEGIGPDGPTKIIGMIEDLAEAGYSYEARQINGSPENNLRIATRYEMLRRRYNHVLENKEYYQQLTQQNIFVVGGVAAGKTELTTALNKRLPHSHGIDVGNLFRVATKAILDEADSNPKFIDNELIALVEAGDEQAAKQFVQLLGRKVSLLRATFASLDYVGDKEHKFVKDGEDLGPLLKSDAVEKLVPYIARSDNVRRAIWNWINNHANKSGSLILTGHSLTDIDTTKYTVIQLDASTEAAGSRLLNQATQDNSPEAAQRRVLERNRRDGLSVTQGILSYIGIESIDTSGLTQDEVTLAALKRIIRHTQDTVRTEKLQNETAIPRESFKWEVNGLVSGIRTAGAEIYASIIDQERQKDARNAPTEFDLSIQTIMQLCGHEPSEVWLGDAQLITHVSELIKEGDAANANELIAEALQAGTVHLNERLVKQIASEQVDRLKAFKAKLYEGRPSLRSFDDAGSSPFEAPNAEVCSKGRQVIIGPDGSKEMHIFEQRSGKEIILRQVKPDVSKAYAEGLHYLHAARDDEYKAFGAFIDGDEYPFAWVSYSPVDRKYKKDMLEYLEVEPHRMLEMTRAWNASWSPKNTMSMLFSFAHSDLQQEWQEAVNKHQRDKPLAGIITAINSNLGFRANAFNGVDFGVIGLKPAGFTYILDETGRASYMPRRSIANHLNIPESKLESNPRFARNKFPLLPTNEMAVLFKGSSRYQIKAPIYKIPEGNYKLTSK